MSRSGRKAASARNLLLSHREGRRHESWTAVISIMQPFAQASTSEVCAHHFLNTFSISWHTASVTSFVLWLPPRSLVLTPATVTFSIACMRTSATASSLPLPTHRTISAADQNAPTGFAMPLPAISGAEPWIGSNMEGFLRVGSRLEEGAMPILPASAAARSERISAWTSRKWSCQCRYTPDCPERCRSLRATKTYDS